MFEQAFKNIDDVLWKEAGCTTELDYTEQTSWMLFLKYLDDLEHERALETELVGKSYDFIIDEPHRWSSWAAPKKDDGSFDHDTALAGDDLIDYVNRDLFPYLQSFKQRAPNPDTIEYKIGEIFGEIKNKFQSGYSLRDALEYMDALQFRSQKQKHELSHLYEAKIKNMGNAGRNGGEYYTPRPLIHTNTLAENISDLQDKDRFDVILANPPFGGKGRKEVQQNFPIKTSETAFLFLQHFMKSLKAGGRAAVVIKNTFLSNGDNASRALRKELLESCNLHTILDCPQGTFQGAGVKTVVLFFEKGAPTRKIWYYQLDPGRSLGKTNALNDDDLKEFVTLQESSAVTEKSWLLDIGDIDPDTYDLSVKNPFKPEEDPIREPEEIIAKMISLDAESADILEDIRGML
nr:N-6 DNA methylase [Nitrosomonas nitrosa]